MTEAEWLTSEDPQAMLIHLHGRSLKGEGILVGTPLVSDRKLRLFSAACFGARHGRTLTPGPSDWAKWEDGEPDVLDEKYPARDGPRRNAVSWCDKPMHAKYRPQFAHLLRDIIGNTWRAVVVLPRDIGRVLKVGADGFRQEDVIKQEWLTPQVLSIAQQAYEERVGRVCDKCVNGYVYPVKNVQYVQPCLSCHGRGHIDDGSLDPATLAVLSDALTDAGCDNEDILRHLRGEVWWNGQYGTAWRNKTLPHVRGCHVLDAILGKE